MYFSFLTILFLVSTSVVLYMSWDMMFAILVAVILSISTSAIFTWLKLKMPVGYQKLGASAIMTLVFFLLLMMPLVYLGFKTADVVKMLDVEITIVTVKDYFEQLKTSDIPYIKEILEHINVGDWLKNSMNWLKSGVLHVNSLIVNMFLVALFYFLFNLYGFSMYRFVYSVLPMLPYQKRELFRTCNDTISLVFYGAVFNFISQGFAFYILMLFFDYDALFLGVMAGFASFIPVIGGALVYLPIILMEVMDQNYWSAVVVFLYAAVFMGFILDNIGRVLFISKIKKYFNFEVKLNEIVVLVSMVFGIAAFGFWGFVIGPALFALWFSIHSMYVKNLINILSIDKSSYSSINKIRLQK